MSTKLNENTNGLQTVLNDINNFEMPGLNIAYGTTPPSDISKLWVPLAQKPDNVEISGDSLQNAVDAIQTKIAKMEAGLKAAATAVINGKIYIFGGDKKSAGNSNLIQEYDPATDTITAKATLTYNVIYSAAVAIGGKAYIFSGNNGDTSTHRHGYIQEYDPVANTVAIKSATFDDGLTQMSAVVISGKAYLFGGYNDDSKLVNTVREYDPVTDTLTTKTATLASVLRGSAAVTINNKAYIFGGYTSSNQVDYIQEYDPATDTMTTKSAVIGHAVGYLFAAAVDDKAYVFGGQHSSYSPDNTIQEYTPKAYLGANHLKVFASVYKSEAHQVVTNIINGKNEQLKLYMTSAFLGDADGYAKAQDAYVYNTSISNWQTLEGTSL